MAEVSAGRILIMAVGNYNAATPYEPLDLVAYNDESWLCRKACTGITPTAQASEYWQKFGSAVGIATVTNTGVVRPDGASIKIIADGTISVPTATGEALGLVKPDGTTITIDANGALTAQAVGALNDLTDVNIASASQGQILQYNVTSHKWENVTKQFLTELEQMADVDIDNSTLADGQALIYDVATGKWQNKAIAQYPKLDTAEQVMANTQSGKVADALAIKAMNTAAVKKFSDSTYVTVDSIAYDETNEVLGLKVNGADTVIPFKKGDVSKITFPGNYYGFGQIASTSEYCIFRDIDIYVGNEIRSLKCGTRGVLTVYRTIYTDSKLKLEISGNSNDIQITAYVDLYFNQTLVSANTTRSFTAQSGDSITF